MSTRLRNFSYVIGRELAAMAFPFGPDALAELSDLGFRSLASLSEEAPAGSQYGLVQLHCPLPDFARIPPLSLRRVMAFIANAPQPVAVHCQGGVGRTGVAVACRLLDLHHFSAEEAIEEVRRLRSGSIDHPALEESVRDYVLASDAAGLLESDAPFNFASASPLDWLVYRGTSAPIAAPERPAPRSRACCRP